MSCVGPQPCRRLDGRLHAPGRVGPLMHLAKRHWLQARLRGRLLLGEKHTHPLGGTGRTHEHVLLLGDEHHFLALRVGVVRARATNI